MNEGPFYLDGFAVLGALALIFVHMRMQWIYGWLIPLFLGASARVILAVVRRGVYVVDGNEMTLTRSRRGKVVGRWLFEEVGEPRLRIGLFGRARIAIRTSTGETLWLAEGRREGMQQALEGIQRLLAVTDHAT